MDFRTACIKENGILSLMRAQPELAAEVLLALIIEDQPEREYGSSGFKEHLGLEYTHDAYPTAFWKSPFFPFLQLAPQTALAALISLVNFCTERWAAEAMKRRTGEVPGVTLQFLDGAQKTFPGWWHIFGWPQSNDLCNGHLFCALDALERWLTRLGPQRHVTCPMVTSNSWPIRGSRRLSRNLSQIPSQSKKPPGWVASASQLTR